MAVSTIYAYSVTGSRDTNGRRSYTVVYKVTTDDPLDDPLKVFAGTNIPQYASPYTFGSSQDLGVRSQTMDCDYWDREASAKMFRVTVTYSNTPARGGRGGSVDVSQSTDNPEQFLPRLSGSFITEIVPYTHDAVKPEVLIENPLGDKFRDAFKPRSYQSLSIELTKASFTPGGVEVPSVNSVTFFGKPILTWRLENIEWDQVHYGATKYYEIRYTFLHNPDKWTFKPRLEGPRYKDSAGNIKSFAADDGFGFGDGYGPLNTDGTKRATTATPKVLYYGIAPSGIAAGKMFPQIDFGSVLGVPTTL